MRAGHRDGRLEPHQLGQHLGAADDRNAPLIGRGDLGIVLLDRGRGHHHRGVAEIVGAVADRDRDAALAQALDDIAFGDVRALHLVAEICASPRRCPTCRCRRCRRSGSCRCRCRRPSCRHRSAAASGAAPPRGRRRDRRRDRGRSARRGRRGPSPRRAGRPLCARSAALASAPGSRPSFCICLASSTGVNLRLRDHPRAAGLGHLARIGGLVVVGRARQRHQDRRAAGRGQLGDGRGAGAGDDEMRPGEPLGQVRQIGGEVGGDAERGIARAHLRRYPRRGIAG